MTKRAGIYVRISEDREGAGLGIRRQEDDCRHLADRLGWEVIDVYADNDLSAFNGKPRPAYERLLQDLRTQEINAVVAWHGDRLQRSPRELEEFINVCEAGDVAIETVQAGPVDLGTPSGRAVARTLGAWARFESEHKSERIRRKARELAEAGRLGGGGTRPFGYEGDRRTVRTSEARFIREAAERIVAGESLRGLVRDWNSRGVPATVTGKPWGTQVMRAMMTSGRIAGWREHRGVLVAPAEWKGIIPRPMLDELRRILLDPARRTTRGRPRRYVLSGLLHCHQCGHRLAGRPRADRVRRYGCVAGPELGGCRGTFILADPTEELVIGAVIEALTSPEFAAALRHRNARDASEVDVDRLRADETALEQLARDYYVHQRIERAEYFAARGDLAARIDRARRRLADQNGNGVLENVVSKNPDVRTLWESRTFDQRRAIIAALIDQIVVGPAVRGRNVFDPSRITIEWKA